MFTLIPVDPSSFDPAFASFLPQYRHPPRSSRVSELLHTNKPPPAFEHDRITALIGSAEGRLADIDEKIAAARHLLHFLSTERDQIASNLSDAKHWPILFADSRMIFLVKFSAIVSRGWTRR